MIELSRLLLRFFINSDFFNNSNSVLGYIKLGVGSIIFACGDFMKLKLGVSFVSPVLNNVNWSLKLLLIIL